MTEQSTGRVESTWRLPVSWLLTPRHWIPLICGVATLVILATGWMRHTPPGSQGAHRVSTPPHLSAPATGRHRAGPAGAWRGHPAPRPGAYLRETRTFRLWRYRFQRNLARLEAQGHSKQARALRLWLAAFEANEGRRAQGGTAQVRRIPATRGWRLAGCPAPPTPAYERYYGYKIVLPWNKAVYCYEANAIPPDSPYLLHPNGIRDAGIPLRVRPDVHTLLAQAGVIDRAARDVLIKVSQYEGGFDAVNTWDTGYVSVGFIQFITGETGAGNSLVRVLARMKAEEDRRTRQARGHRHEFADYFARHGIDVQDGTLLVTDPCSGKRCSGADAVNLLIHDKRLIAVFQDAGLKSRAFQVAQIREAYGNYYMANSAFNMPAAEVSVYEVTRHAPAVTPPTPAPAAPAEPVIEALGDSVSAPVAAETPPPPAVAQATVKRVRLRYVYGAEAVRQALCDAYSPAQFARLTKGTPREGVYRVCRRLSGLRGTYGGVLRSEGGKVTLTDRAVQHGVQNATLAFEASVNALAPDHPLTLAELRARETELIEQLRNRIDVLAQRPSPGARL